MNRRWSVLAVGLLAMIAGCAYQYGLPYLVPALRADTGLSLSRAAALISCPVAGLLVSLALWGVAADRWGERIILSVGLAVAGAALLAATAVHHLVALGVCFFVAGAGGASIHAASGRLILGWFAAHERGLAMGIRQTGQPLGVGVAALVLPPLAGRAGLGSGLVFLACCCLTASTLVAVLVRDPARTATDQPHGGGSPYRTPVLWRIHAASALLIVPQFAVSAFALVYLVDARGWDAATAGRLLAAAQIGGAVARLAVGHWSDRVGGRLGPMRVLALAIGAVMLVLTAGALADWGIASVVLVIAAVITVTTNGLAFTAVAEYAGRAWAGRALGFQNTGQNLLAAATPPVLGSLITGSGYGAAFAVAVAFPIVAGLLVPVGAERGSAAGANREPGTVPAGAYGGAGRNST